VFGSGLRRLRQQTHRAGSPGRNCPLRHRTRARSRLNASSHSKFKPMYPFGERSGSPITGGFSFSACRRYTLTLMASSRTTRWILVLCFIGQAMLSIVSGGRICFACGPTFCHGVELTELAADEKPCCDKCSKELPEAPSHPFAPEKCCCDHAVPMSDESRRVEPVIAADAHRHIFQPLTLDPLALLVTPVTFERPVVPPRDDSAPPLRPSDGITITRLLI